MEEWAICAEHISRKFAALTAVDDISLRIAKGTIYGFLGPNGCGKSTTLRMLTGLLTPSSGRINVLGYSIPRQADKLRLNIGYMTQKFSLYSDLSVEENLRFMGTIYGLTGRKLAARSRELLSRFDLNELRAQRVQGLSGGERQRLSLAAATIHSPPLLFLDEPTSAVDPQNRRDFWETLFDLCADGTTILVTTHYMDEAERCHRLAIMQSGKLRADDTPENLMQQLGVQIVEVKARDLRGLKARLLSCRDVHSAAQLGMRLRVLIDKTINDPRGWLRQHFAELAVAELTLVRPTLEDVFVSVTGGRS